MRNNKAACVACGATTQLQQNHVGGRENAPLLTAWMCKECHLKVFTRLQWVYRVLPYEPGRPDSARLVAVAIGLLLTNRITAQRIGDASTELISGLIGPATSPLIGAVIGPPNYYRANVRAASRVNGDIAGHAASRFALLRDVALMLYGNEHPITRLYAFVADKPEEFIEWLNSNSSIIGDIQVYADMVTKTLETFLGDGGSSSDLANAILKQGDRLMTCIAHAFLDVK